MAQGGAEAEARLGGFDRSFLIVMIRDFFLILVLVTVAEFAIKGAMVYWKHQNAGPAEAQDVAEALAADVRAIMLNEGGPVAARALYPIMQRNLADLGWRAAIDPSAVTVSSIEETFGFRPRGAPADAWPEGRHVEAVTEIRAEAFCQSCHVQAEIGDVLGVVTVRRYLDQDLSAWRDGLQLTGLLSVGKILLHSVLLFVLLKARMAPLIELRAVVGGLSRAFGGLSARAPVTSGDEFGALARDLNLFLDRIQRVVAELDAVLHRVVVVNDDIVKLQTDLRDRLDGFASAVRRVERNAMLAARREPMLSAEWFDAMRGAIEGARAAGLNDPQALAEKLGAVVAHAEAQIGSNMALFEQLAALGEDSEAFRRDLAEMSRLEERMRGVVETGAGLLSRLRAPEPRRG